MITLDGVMQAPGAPEKDTSGGFKYGGWVAPYFDEVYGKVMEKQMKPADLLLGRKTFEIFCRLLARAWKMDGQVSMMSQNTSCPRPWKSQIGKTQFSQKLGRDIEKLKNSKDSDIQVHGSGKLIQLLLKNNLVDGLWLKIHPLTLGKVKKLFDDGTIPAAFTLIESYITPSGVIIANYKQDNLSFFLYYVNYSLFLNDLGYIVSYIES